MHTRRLLVGLLAKRNLKCVLKSKIQLERKTLVKLYAKVRQAKVPNFRGRYLKTIPKSGPKCKEFGADLANL